MRRDDVEHALDALASEASAPNAGAAAVIARGRRRIVRQRLLIVGIAAVVVATAAGVGAIANNDDDARRVVAPVPTTSTTSTTTPFASSPAQQIAVASPLEAWKCLDPMEYTNDGGRSWHAIDIPSSNTQPSSAEAMLCDAVPGGNAWAMWPTSDFRERYVLRVRDFTNVRIFRFPQISGDEFLSAPTFVDADHGWVQSHVGDAPLALYRTVDGGETWAIVTRNQRLAHLEFTSANEGWSLYGDELSSTSDGGASWQRLALPTAEVPPGQLVGRFGVSVHGDSIVVWSGVSVAASDNGPHHTFFDVSADRGQTWTRRDGPTDFEQPSYKMFNATDASHWQTLSDPALRTTSDGGQSWQPQPNVPGPPHGYSMSFPTPDIGWITTATGTILRTIDGGRTWTDVTNGAAPATTATAPPPITVERGVPAQLAFASATEGWICGDLFEYTTDAFETFERAVEIPAPVRRGGQRPLCTAVPGGNAWLVRGSRDPDQPEIVRIRSGGADVGVFGFPRISPLSVDSISFVDADNGWALVGSDASTRRDLYQTKDGGATWSLLLRDTPAWASIDFETIDRGRAAAESGGQLVTTNDGGRSWRAVDVPTPAPHRSLPLNVWKVDVGDNVVVAFSGQTTGNFFTPFFDVSSDRGRTWRRSPGPRALLRGQPNVFGAADADHWVLAWAKYLYFTDDGGTSWIDRGQLAGLDSIEDIARLDANVAVVSGLADSPSSYAVVLRTTDGGNTWTPVG